MSNPLTCIHVDGADGCPHLIARNGSRGVCTLCNRRGYYTAVGWLRWQTHLCEACQVAYDEDNASYEEFGDHPAGIARWEALRQELAKRDAVTFASAEEIAERNKSIPF